MAPAVLAALLVLSTVAPSTVSVDPDHVCQPDAVEGTIEAAVLAECLAEGALVALEGTRVLGLLDLSGIGEVQAPFRCRGCVFAGDLTMADTRFLRMVDLTGATFEGTVSARASVFDAAFLAGPLGDQATVFTKSVDFSFAAMRDPALFEQAHFHSEAVFDHSIWTRPAKFVQTVFDDVTSFDNASFSSGAVLRGTQFNDDISFQRASGGRIDFSGARIRCSAEFAFLSSASTVTFEGVIFDKPPESGAEITASSCSGDETFRSFTDLVAADFRLDLAVVSDIGSEHVQVAVLKLVQASAVARGDLSVANDATASLRSIQANPMWDIPYRWLLGYLVKPLYPMASFVLILAAVALWQKHKADQDRIETDTSAASRSRDHRWAKETSARFGWRRGLTLAFTKKDKDEQRSIPEHVVAWTLKSLTAVWFLAIGNSTEIGRELIEAVF